MKVEYYYYDQNKKDHVTTTTVPASIDNMWHYIKGVYLPNKSTVSIKDDTGKLMLSFVLWMGYCRCCGLREIGDINFVWAATEAQRKAAVQELFNLEFFKKQNVGALLYTRVKSAYDAPRYREGDFLCANWPGTVTEGGWWFNPNSGNYCCNVTLSLNVNEVVYEDDEDEEED
jgi:hypothetical protein